MFSDFSDRVKSFLITENLQTRELKLTCALDIRIRVISFLLSLINLFVTMNKLWQDLWQLQVVKEIKVQATSNADSVTTTQPSLQLMYFYAL